MWFLLPALFACTSTPTPDDSGAVDDTGPPDTGERIALETPLTVWDPTAAECGDDDGLGLFWPMTNDFYPLVVVTVPLQPAPPYDIHSLSVRGYSGGTAFDAGSRSCNTLVPMRASVWVSSTGAIPADPEDGTWPVVEPLVEGVLTGSGVPGSELMTLEFDPPVRVHDVGLLMMGLHVESDPGTGNAACAWGCGVFDTNMFMPPDNLFGAPPGYYPADWSPDVRVELTHGGDE